MNKPYYINSPYELPFELTQKDKFKKIAKTKEK